MDAEREKAAPSEEEACIVQDGVVCPKEPPWKPGVMKWTTFAMVPFVIMAVCVLAVTNVPKLLLWLLLLGVFAYPLRYLICARCPYYGQHCSTYFGLWVPRLFKKQEGKSMRLGLWLDVVFFVLLFALPLPEVWQLGGFALFALWVGLQLAMLGVISRLACLDCPLTFCPIGQMSRSLWRRSG